MCHDIGTRVALSTPDSGLDQMRFDVRVAGLPCLQIQVDLEPRLLVAERVRDLDDDGSVAIRVGLAFDTPQELEQLLTGIWVTSIRISPCRSLWVMFNRLSSSSELQGRPTSSPATLTSMGVLSSQVERESELFTQRRERMAALVAELRERTAPGRPRRRGQGGRAPPLARQADRSGTSRPAARSRQRLPRARARSPRGRCTRDRPPRRGSSPESASSRARSA